MQTGELISITDAAGRLGVRPGTIADLLRIHGRDTQSIPYSPRGRGIDPETYDWLRRMLTPGDISIIDDDTE